MAADKGGGRRGRGPGGPGRTGDRPSQGRPPRSAAGDATASSDVESAPSDVAPENDDADVAGVFADPSANDVVDGSEVEVAD